MVNVVTWLWTPEKDYHAQYTPHHVNILYRMVRRHYKNLGNFICVTDCISKGASPYHPSICLVPFLRDDLDSLKNPYGPGTPSCYRRLPAFSTHAYGPRFVSLDLDCVVLDDLSPVFDRPEEFIIWRSFARQTQYNGSMWMMDACVRSQVWEKFRENPQRAISRARAAGFYGSDQAWINYILGPKEHCWGEHDGVYSFRRHLRNENAPPKNARIVFFEGRYSPWDAQIQQKHPWILQHYR